MRLRFALLALTSSLVACGARSQLSEAGAPGGPGKPTLVVIPIDDFFQSGDQFTSARIVARNQGFDLLGLQMGDPDGVIARRATVTTDPLGLEFAGPPGQLFGDTLDGFEAAAVGDVLAVCHNHSAGDPIFFSSYTGTYTAAASTMLFGCALICDGIAFGPSSGMAAVNADGPFLEGVSSAGAVTGTTVPALPSSEITDVSLARYGNGYLSAGFVQAPGVFIRFVPDAGPTTTTQIPVSAVAYTRPRLAAWPFDATQAAVAFLDGTSLARLLVVGEGGAALTETISAEAQGQVTRPSVAAVTEGLLDAYTSCPAGAGMGTIHIELRGATGAPIAAPAVLPGVCPAGVDLAAALGDVALFGWPNQSGGYGGALVQVTYE